jgi:hypothetical protein
MTTTRRTFLGTTLLAASATALPHFSYALIVYQDASHGIVVTERDRVVKDLQAFLEA